MNTRAVLIGVAAVLALLIIAALAWLGLGGRAGGLAQGRAGVQAAASNPALDVRYTYNTGVFTPAPYEPRGEYSLRLDGAGFSFYGKRIRGVGRMVDTSRIGGMLYDFVGAEHLESFEKYYNLVPAGEPNYEDAQIGGRLGLHQQAQYNFTGSSAWPEYFPAQFQETPPPASAFVEGWAVFTEQDLFFFQAVGVHELTSEQRAACQQVMDSLQFGAVLGGAAAPAETPAAAGDGGEARVSGDAGGDAEPGVGVGKGDTALPGTK